MQFQTADRFDALPPFEAPIHATADADLPVALGGQFVAGKLGNTSVTLLGTVRCFLIWSAKSAAVLSIPLPRSP